MRRPSSCTRCQPNLRLERLAELVVGQVVELLLELRHERAGSDPAEVAAVGRRARVLGGDRRDGLEALALQDALADLHQLLPHGLVVLDLVGGHQDVARVHLRDERLLRRAAYLEHLEDVQAARRADRFGDVARLHGRDDVGHEGGQLVPPCASRARRLRAPCRRRSTRSRAAPKSSPFFARS